MFIFAYCMQKILVGYQFAALICLILLQPPSSFGQQSCQSLFSRSEVISQEIRLAQEAWIQTNFTQAIRHNDNKFLYIVHAGPNVTSNGADPVIAFANHIRKHDFNRDGFFSSSVISQDHTATFSWSGVILEIPKEKIIAATSEDMRSTDADKLNLEQGLLRFRSTPLSSPSAILSKASGGTGFFNSDMSWTEVITYGQAPSLNRIKVTGVFAHKDSLGLPILTAPRNDALQVAAEEMGVPFILIPPPRGNFVLNVRMTGERKPIDGHFMTDYGPQRIEFFESEESVRALFKQAQLQGVQVRLVDPTGGPVSGLADEALFSGGWRDRWKSYSPVALPDGTPQIDIHFLR